MSTRDLWSVSLIRFRGAIEDSAGLVAWADRNRTRAAQRARFVSVSLTTFEPTESAMAPSCRCSAAFRG